MQTKILLLMAKKDDILLQKYDIIKKNPLH